MLTTIGELRHMIRESVVDAAGRFRAKRSNDLTDKLTSIASEVPNAFAEQERLEKEFNELFRAVRSLPDEALGGRKRVRLRLAPVFREFGDNTTLFDVVTLTGPDDPGYDVLVAFVRDNSIKFQRSVDDVKRELERIAEMADVESWPAPWRRYTNWGHIQSDVGRYADAIGRLTRR